MPLSLEQYATWLDGRHELPWPAPPKAERIKARPHIGKLPGIRAVFWNVYGTLLAIPFGDLLFEHPTPFVMTMALEKTIAEFKMWQSMSRKPGAPSEYMGQIYRTLLVEQRMAPSRGEKHPEIIAERVWEGVLKKLLAKEYKFDAGFYGSLNEYSRKIAYFFHASLQGTAAYKGADRALKSVVAAGLAQGLIANGQCFTTLQLQRGLSAQDNSIRLEELIPAELSSLSCEVRGRKPSERLFQPALDALAARGIEPHETLHVGSSLSRDLLPAKKLGMRTALFAGDRASLDADMERLNDRETKPDVLLTKLEQIAEVVVAGVGVYTDEQTIPTASSEERGMPPEVHFDVSTLDQSRVLVDRDEIHRVNPQRFEMAHLDGILHLDREREIIIGYKDVRDDEFWVRGHMPGMPLLPGVLMCEAAAQLGSYYAMTSGTLGPHSILGLGGLEDVRFRGTVRPGDRLVLVAKTVKLKSRQSIFDVQGFVGTTMVFHAQVIGIRLDAPPGS